MSTIAPARATSWRARWVFPVSSPPISGGFVTTCAGRIVHVGSIAAGDETRDLGDVALVPGLVNAHTHLELSHCEQPIGEPQMPFADWIHEVVRQRRAAMTTATADQAHAQRCAAVQRGLDESAASGVTTLCDIATPSAPIPAYRREDVASVVMRELLGLADDRQDALMATAVEHLDNTAAGAHGLSPHAPYTVSLELVSRVCELSAARRCPVAMHLAESWDELELLAAHSGRFLEVLQELNAWNAGAVPRGARPLDYLERLANAHRALVIHGNFLTTDEMKFLAERRQRMAVVYCPRTHAFFLREKHPLPEMLAAGVQMAIGTDSRASNPDLNLFDELRFIAANESRLSFDTILRLGTLDGAAALGLAHDRGSLEVGKRADVAVVGVSSETPDDPHALLFAPAARLLPVVGSER